MTNLSETTDPEVRRQIRKGKRRAILPIGSVEQHGAHMPLASDAMIAEEVTRRVSRLIDAFVLPPIYYGVSHEHKPLFNISIRNETLASLVADICISLAENGFNRIVLLNAHYGNEPVLASVAQTIYDRIPRGTLVYSLSYWTVMDEGIGHADGNETSLMLAIRPDLVSMKSAKASRIRIGKIRSNEKLILDRLTALPSSFPKFTSSGVWGDPRKATSKKGRRLLNQVSRKLADAIKDIESVYDKVFKARN
jgi:creatinine amidohydrolase